MKRSIRLLSPLFSFLILVLLALALRATAAPSEPEVSPLTEDDAVDAYYRGDLDLCLRAYAEVLTRKPADLPARANRARVLRESGRLEEALEELDQLLILEPDDEPARLAAAETAVLALRPDLALQHLGFVTPSVASRYLSALALIDLGHRTEAAGLLAELHGLQDFHPMAWYWAARLKYEGGEYAEAELLFHKALKQEPNLTLAFPPLARTYLAQGQEDKAFGFLGRAQTSLPGNAEIRDLLRELGDRRPQLVESGRVAQERRRETAMPRQATVFPEDREALPLIRIGLVEKARQVYLKTGAPFRLSVAASGGAGLSPAAGGADNAGGGSDGGASAGSFGGTPDSPAAGPAGAVLTVRWEGGAVEVTDAGGNRLLRAAEPIQLSYQDPAATTILFDVEFGRGSFWAGSEDRMYRGIIELDPRTEGLTVISRLSIEEYLYSVLPSEMPSYWPAAALQAQAVAARTYTVANLGRFASRGFDLLGSVASAAYGGLRKETDSCRAAVDETRGLVLVSDGKLVPAFYSANSGGHTETTGSVWNFPSVLTAAADLMLPARSTPLPPESLARWLAARPASHSSHPDYSSRSAYRWQIWVPREEIESRLDRGEALGSIRAILPGLRGLSGRVREVRILGTHGEHEVTMDSIRWRLGGLRSNLFTVQPKLGADGLPEYFIFTGGGWGHGVGMCQSGAAGMAAAGYSAEEILHHYYGSAELERRY